LTEELKKLSWVVIIAVKDQKQDKDKEKKIQKKSESLKVVKRCRRQSVINEKK